MTQTKDTNPKDGLGIRRVPTHVIPARVMYELGLVLLEGACKYGSFNWRAAGVRASVYYDAMRRHVDSWWEGEDMDPDTDNLTHHLTKGIACLTILRDSIMQGNMTDDRPIRSKPGWINDFNEKAGKLLDKYPEPKADYTQLAAEAPTKTETPWHLPAGYVAVTPFKVRCINGSPQELVFPRTGSIYTVVARYDTDGNHYYALWLEAEKRLKVGWFQSRFEDDFGHAMGLKVVDAG